METTESTESKNPSPLPSVDTLHEDSDVSAVMLPDTHEDLRKMVLRKLFHLPKFNRRDGLDDYDDDYRSFKPLGDILTSDRRHQLEHLVSRAKTRHRQRSADAAKATAGLSTEAAVWQQEHNGPDGHFDYQTSAVTDCILCRTPFSHTDRTNISAHCAQWFDQCPSNADAEEDDPVPSDRVFDPEPQMQDEPVQARMPVSNVKAYDISMAVHAATEACRESGEGGPVVIFHDSDPAQLKSLIRPPGVSDAFLYFPLSGIGLRLDTWLAALAWGAARVVVIAGRATGPVLSRLEDQMLAMEAILDGLGLEKERFRLVGPRHADSASLSAELTPLIELRELPSTNLEPVACGRAMIYGAMDALLAQDAPAKQAVLLPEGLPFGEVRINSHICTLCMACVAACPTQALWDGGQDPQILFQEERCIQCDLCKTACPETAIERTPRMLFDPRTRQARRCLHQADPVCCVVCGRPFAVGAMVDKMARQLANHWMYQSDAAKRRLRMCRDCRVQDFFRENTDVDRE